VFSSRVNVGKENSRTAESERERFSKWADIGNEWVKMHHQRVEILKVGEHGAPCGLLLGWNPRRSAKMQSGRNTGCPDVICRNIFIEL